MLRYFTNSTSFEPLSVQFYSELTVNRSVLDSYAVRFSGLLSAAASGRYTFSFSDFQSQQLSLSLSIDGVELSKLQPDGGIKVRVLLLS